MSASDEESQKSDEDDISEDSNIDADVESATSASADEKDVITANEGWADSVAKILGSKKPKNKKTLVLSRAKKHADVLKQVKEEKPEFEVIGDVEVKVVKKEEATSEPPVKKIVSINLKNNLFAITLNKYVYIYLFVITYLIYNNYSGSIS